MTHLTWLAGFLLLAGIAAAISVGKGYSVSDEIVLWGAKGYGIAASGSPANIQEWGTNTVLYPLHLPILIAAFKVLFAETLPAAKLAFSGYYLALILLAYGVFTWKGVRREVAGLATLLLATTPLVFRHATIAYANLPFSFYLAAGMVMLVEALLSTESRQSRQAYPLSGLFFTTAAWTRPEGLWIVLLGILALLVLRYVTQRRLPALKLLVLLFSPIVVYLVFWTALKAAVYTQPAGRVDLMTNAASQILSGNLHPDEAFYVMRALLVGLFTPADWGMLGFGLVAVAILALLKGIRGRPSSWMLAACGGLCVVVVGGMYFLTSYDSAHDISWWVSTGLERMLLPAMVLLWLGAILGMQPFNHSEDRPIASGLEQS